jgi:NAD(P)-dependent dehydrogenase (short-subunit alcohol dehydrogenase family)
MLARSLAETGYLVAGIASTDEETVRVPEACAVMHVAQPTDEAMVRLVMGRIADEIGRPGALIHTVGMWDGRPLLETSLADWEMVVRVNLTSTFIAFKEAIRVMLPGPASLIAFSSGQGADGGRANQGSYSAAKAGVMRLVEAVAEEYADEEIWPVAVAPSLIRFGDESAGVDPGDLLEVCRHILQGGARALRGSTVRAYGNRPT